MPNPFPFQVLMVCLVCKAQIGSNTIWTPDGALVSYEHSSLPGKPLSPVYNHQAQPTPVPPEEYRK